MSASEKTPLTQEKGAFEDGSYSKEPAAVVYVRPGGSYTHHSGGDFPEDYMIMSILTILFCCWPLGIVALMKSLEVRNAIARGDLATAQVASRAAHKFNKLSVMVGIISTIVIVAFVLIFQLAWIIPVAVSDTNSTDSTLGALY